MRHAGTGRLLWRVPVGPRSQVRLEYTYSLYGAPTAERFEVAAGGLRLVEVSSTEEAVLEHLGLPPPYHRRGDELVGRSDGAVHTRLTVRIGPTGRQRLWVDGHDLPLYRVGTGEAVEIVLRRVPRVILWLGTDTR
ncbi:MAG: hypothetical protein QN163_00970 [Armatimonadota bacterium]|nr:hypothetical protein [Armatimonadota bacterium]MDR5697634.1 hypothetical protein [Armatimonadota bacterium]